MDTDVRDIMPEAPVRRRSRTAFVAAALFGGAYTLGRALRVTGWFGSDPPGAPTWVVVVAFASLALLVASLVVGIVALVQIRRSGGALTGRVMAWLSVILSTIALTVGVVSAVASPSRALVKDDFEEGRFWTEDDDPTVRQRFVDGGYEVLIRSTEQPSYSRYFSDEQASSTLTFSSSATIVDDAGGNTYAGLSCWASPAYGYLAAVGSDGSVAILRAFNDRPPEDLSEDAGRPQIALGETTRLSMECLGGGSKPTTIVLRADGFEIARAEDPEGLDGFMGVGLWYGADRPGAVIRWNDSSTTS
jgi:hypothetical protein